ncbi:hypothetical protein BS78_04G026200 [Paspalum vaginatum]|uniref:NB-ARC domain-containing protein n=1 Tax=Paspalum vaginatum TaxID=158149 RepID=A0A9W7X6U0_9POAL|nr:hypothetical protein BS78_K251500 [Paspalum vaginatum]KAJ1277728.1 hypothetical protein BS78_04G026200 [Paspalum vaginatum]
MEALQWVYSAVTNFYDESQLNNELDRLRATLPKARLLISRSQWDMFKNKQLAELLSRLKDTIYDAEDLLRELGDQALRLKIEGADRCRAGQLLSSFLNLGKNFVHGSKARIKEAQDKLDKVVAEIEGVLNLMGLMSVKPSQIMPETSSLISAPEVVGRDGERDVLIEMLGVTLGRETQRDQVIQLLGVPLTRGRKRAASQLSSSSSSRAALAATNCTDKVSVISIVGIGGVGKTTLAQFIYNDPRVEHHFGVKIWVCVSDFFDKRRITVEIFKSIPGEIFNPSSCTTGEIFNPSSCTNLDDLQVKLKKRLKSCPKFLLVLDDIWPNANADWETFYAPLRKGPQGSMILVTTRCPLVATRVTTRNFEPVELQGLPTDIFWDFFRRCAFGTNDPGSYPHLQDIGRSISTRLCGSPLAAKTLGRLLNMSLTEQHWRTVQKSELWELRHEHNEILPALQLSYLYLPEEIKRCFLFCSMFPKDYSFQRDKIVGIWVAQGFVVPGGSLCPEDVATTYLDELRNRFLFQTDPKFPNETRYVMHDLIHDMAVSFSTDECLVMQGSRDQHKSRMQNTVRHMSIEAYCESLTRMGDIQHLSKLHSLRFGIRFDAEITWFSQLSNIIFLSLEGCYLGKLPESICELSSLRYLDISHSSVEELPKKVKCLYGLQFLDASHSKLRSIQQDVTKLINLRQLALPGEASQALSTMRGLGNLSCLQNLSVYTVVEDSNRGIGELKFMNQLNGSLCIRSLARLRSEEEAAKARLVEKQYLKELVLQWREIFTNGFRCNSENGVFEGLRPHSRIECLKIHGFFGDTFPSWFKPEDLPTLRSLELSDCGYLESSPVPCFAGGSQAGFMVDDITRHVSSSNGIAPFAFTHLTDLRVYRCSQLKNLEQFLTPEKLPSIKSITLQECRELVSIPVHRFVRFEYLQDLKICVCPKLECPQKMVLPPSLQRLCIVRCNELDMSFPACLKNLTSLSFLQLVSCDNIKCIPLNSIGSKVLKCLVVSLCRELSSIGGSQCLASIQHVQLSCCHKLAEVQLPFEKKELGTKEGKELIKYLY